ncbi:MAG: helix-turn-helix domain-containing protein [Treponema sp.]|nr:helix-turn-helix domain-containing protein [Treponema sp.]MCL2272913.1 helix-turn-helix domain-containing protein [Treponema sp.]
MKENIIKNNQNNDTFDFIEKVKKVMLDYNQATGCSVCIYDKDYNPHYLEPLDHISEQCPEKNNCSCKDNSCHEIHKKAIKESAKTGRFYIYQCKAGFLFWSSSIYTDGRFSGAVRGGGFLKTGQKPVDFFPNANDNYVMCNSEINREEQKDHKKAAPEADNEKIQSMAEMMQLCAESLNSGNEDYHEVIRRRAEQQETIAKIIEDLKVKCGKNTEKPGYPLDKEKSLMAALRKGDCAEAKRILNEILAMVIFSNQDENQTSENLQISQGHFKYIQLRITELVVLISRVEINPAKNGNLSMEINSQNLKFVQEAKTVEELTDIIHTIIDRVSGSISSFRGIPHAAALRKAENFILENYTRKISLKEIADVAGLSPPYFSTIFKDEMGENLSKYLNRLRVEKASRLLLETDMSLSEIAACCCFEDQSWFSKIFKAYTGISPGKYRNQGGGLIRNNEGNNLSEGLLKS